MDSHLFVDLPFGNYLGGMFQEFGISTVIVIVNVIILCVGVIFYYHSSLASSYKSDARLLICSTSHTRFFPVRHSFSYPLLYVFFPIDKTITSNFFGVDKWRIFYVKSDDYLGSPPCGSSLIEKLRWHLDQHVHSMPLPY
jgi:Protein of unknown function (DUF1365)